MRLSDFIDAIDSPGGHIIGLQVLLYSAAISMALGYHVPKAEDIIVGSFGALLAKLSGGLSNAARMNGHSTPTRPSIVAPAPAPAPKKPEGPSPTPPTITI